MEYPQPLKATTTEHKTEAQLQKACTKLVAEVKKTATNLEILEIKELAERLSSPLALSGRPLIDRHIALKQLAFDLKAYRARGSNTFDLNSIKYRLGEIVDPEVISE